MNVYQIYLDGLYPSKFYSSFPLYQQKSTFYLRLTQMTNSSALSKFVYSPFSLQECVEGGGGTLRREPLTIML